MTLFWPRTRAAVEVNAEGTFSLGSAGLPARLASEPPRGASGLAVKSTGTTAWLAAMAGASIAMPGGNPCTLRFRSPPKSVRLPRINAA